MNILANLELVDETATSESCQVRRFMENLSLTLKSNNDSENAIHKILSDAYFSAGFGPVLAVLQNIAAQGV